MTWLIRVGSPPIIKVTALTSRTNLVDVRFHMLNKDDIRVHFHLVDAPFAGPLKAELQVDILQESSCSVEKVELIVDYWASLGKLPLRFRSAAITWPMGWISLMLSWRGEGAWHDPANANSQGRLRLRVPASPLGERLV